MKIERWSIFWVCVCCFMMGFALGVATLAHSKDILISFDGSARTDMWEDSLKFAKENNVKFTYFISAPYFLVNEDLKGHPYWAEREIGYAPLRIGNRKTIVHQRFMFLRDAVVDGHEIASHLCGHYDGSRWTYEQWMKEMDFFRWTFSKAREFDVRNIVGIRAPLLATNDAYFKAIKECGFRYDSSDTSDQDWPGRLIPEIPIRKIKVVIAKPFLNSLVFNNDLPFDYNFSLNVGARYMRKIFFDSLCYDYLACIEPTQVCLHFQEYDGDPYYNAMKDFVLWVKDKGPQYKTYKELLK